eukprot:TRINITY_DN13321_c0_g1_i1.p1 TRINITY_DN13321_c0_g1~~TRINITY_DN13321_c0_g1_i1.p1  ORF type:complete len:374 (+),score=102.56 TRINITY_DN13321_c0_g1_i1:127-1248(+)
MKLLSSDPEACVHAPDSLLALLQLRASLPHARVFQGNIDSQYQARKHHNQWLVCTRVAQLSDVALTATELRIGSGVYITSFLEKAALMSLKSEFGLSMICEQLRESFTPQVRNCASMISAAGAMDITPVLVAAGASVVIASLDPSGKGIQTRQLALRDLMVKKGVYANVLPTEVVLELVLPMRQPDAHSFCWGFKQAARRENSLGWLAAGFSVTLSDGAVKAATVATGGMGPALRLFERTEQFLCGKPWNASTVQAAKDVLAAEAQESSYQGREEYKASVMLSALSEFFELSVLALHTFHYPASEDRTISVGIQSYQARKDTSGLHTTVGMAACEGYGDLQQPGIASRLTQIAPDHANTVSYTHLTLPTKRIV